MLNQIDIYIKRTDLSDIWSDLAVKVHGFIMSRVPSSFAEECHNGKVQPFSIYCYYGEDYGIIRISTLTDSAKVVIESIKDCKTIKVYGSKENLEVIKVDESPEISFEALVNSMQSDRFTWTIVSPAMYRSVGVLKFDPCFPAYFESVIQKIEAFEGLSITRSEVNAAFEKMQITKYGVMSESFVSGKRRYLGMVGSMNITIEPNLNESNVLKTILAYATYSGIGGMTTQGMGGTTIQIRQKRRENNE